jgi:hypothetical protein
VIFQQQVQIEKQKNSETIQLYNVAVQDLQQEKNISEMQKKLISELEGVIGIYQAGYQPVEAQSENAFTSGAVDAPLPAFRSEESIRQEYRTTETPGNSGGHQNLSKEVMPILPVTNSNNYGFSYVTDSSSFQKLASTREMPSLPVEMSSGFPNSSLATKGTVTCLPPIEEADSEDHAGFEFVMDPDFNPFPVSSLRATPYMAGFNEHKDHGCHDHDKVADSTGSADLAEAALGSKRGTEKEGGKQRKRQRKPKSITITSPVN